MKKSERDYFIGACFANNLQEYYSSYIQEKYGAIQHFNQSPILEHKYWMPSKYCCETGVELSINNIDVKVGYWTPFIWKPIHKDVKKKAMAEEAYACQLIDMNCNDCLHFVRHGSLCGKKNERKTITPNICTPDNINCFEHRKK